jgi:hypothetical protein
LEEAKKIMNNISLIPSDYRGEQIMPKRFWQISPKTRKQALVATAILSMVGALLGSSIYPIVALATASPQFNIFTPYVHEQTFNRDYYLLDVKNDTDGTSWGFPAVADPNDVLTFYIYYHNGINYTTANNTTLKVNMPSGSATSQTVTGSLWSDNSLNAAQASPLTQSVQVNLSSSQSLQYVAGSAKWYPNQADWRTGSPVAFPNGQSDNQLFTSGINIGDVNGCWEFSGAIVFKAKVGNFIPPGALTIDKKMKNITTSDTVWSDSLINVHPRHRLAVQLVITNTGAGPANNVVTSDTLPNRLIYVNGSNRVDGAAPSSGSITSGLNLGTLAAGQSKTIYFEVDVATETNFTRGETVLINTGLTSADTIASVQDSVNVRIDYNGCTFQTDGTPSGR